MTPRDWEDDYAGEKEIQERINRQREEYEDRMYDAQIDDALADRINKKRGADNEAAE